MDPQDIANAIAAITESLASQRGGIDSVMLSLDQALTQNLQTNAATIKAIVDSVKKAIARDVRRNDSMLGPVLNDVLTFTQSAIEEQAIALQNAAASAASGGPEIVPPVTTIPLSASSSVPPATQTCNGPGQALWRWRNDGAWEPVTVNPCPDGWVRDYPTRDGTFVGETICLGCSPPTSNASIVATSPETATSRVEPPITVEPSTLSEPPLAPFEPPPPSVTPIPLDVALYAETDVPPPPPPPSSVTTPLPPIPVSPVASSPPIVASSEDVQPDGSVPCCAFDWQYAALAFWSDAMTQTMRDDAFARSGLSHWIGAKNAMECRARSILGNPDNYAVNPQTVPQSQQSQ